MKVICPNCGKGSEYSLARNFEGKVECHCCRALMWVVVAKGELQETRIYGEPEARKPIDISISEHDIEETWKRWEVGSWVDLEDFKRLVKTTYPQLVERARNKKTICYGELEVYNELQARFGEGVRTVIGQVVGACGEGELRNGRPPISAIVVAKDTGCPGQGFYGLSELSGTPQDIAYDTWEGKGIKGEAIPIEIQIKRVKFWQQKLKEVHAFWAGKENEH
ncbi:MAG: hypothetical protein J7L92_04850 [Dehalococcoidia bacterium]|nr:hypothetical protein [Dehalococcoidia bacterium]